MCSKEERGNAQPFESLGAEDNYRVTNVYES